MTIITSIVVAVASNNVIGNDDAMPWHLSTDLKRFKALTLGKPMIMGRKTFEAIGGALPGRTSIVVTRDKNWQAPGGVPAGSLEIALEVGREIAEADGVDEICIAGGGEIYRQAIELADVVHLTRVHATPEGDTVFPEIDMAVWSLISSEDIPSGPKDSAATTYCVYKRS